MNKKDLEAIFEVIDRIIVTLPETEWRAVRRLSGLAQERLGLKLSEYYKATEESSQKPPPTDSHKKIRRQRGEEDKVPYSM